jgi:hypothetical protein
MTGTDQDIERLVVAFVDICAGPGALRYPAGFRDSGIAVVSAVFSMQARDESVRRVVRHFVDYRGLDGAAALDPLKPEPDGYSVADLAADLHGVKVVRLKAEYFDNASKSVRADRSKAELVQEVSEKLAADGVRSRADVAMQPSGPDYDAQKRLWTGVRGLGWVTFEYFRLLCGAETAKPDMMIHRWLNRVLERPVDGGTALELVRLLAGALEREWSQRVSVRAVDHTIWFHESERAETA